MKEIEEKLLREPLTGHGATMKNAEFSDQGGGEEGALMLTYNAE